MNFSGLIITDDLEMGGAQKNRQFVKSSDLAKQALEAGNDMLMVVWSIEKQSEILDGLEKMVLNGEISENLIDEKVRRILSVKKEHGFYFQEEDNKFSTQNFNNDESRKLVKEILTHSAIWKYGSKDELQSYVSNDWKKSWNDDFIVG